MTDHESFSSTDFLDRLQKREHAAVTSVVNHYTRQLYRAALGLGFPPASADEITQNVWGTFFQILPGFRGASHIRTFLFGILYNKAKEFQRERSNNTVAIDDAFEQHFDAESGRWSQTPIHPERFLESMETADIIQACLDELSFNQRAAFVLRELDGNSTEEICKILEVSDTNLGVILHRARNRLRDCVEAGSKGEQS